MVRLSAVALAIAALSAFQALAAPRFSISFPKERSSAPLDGRLLLLVSTDPSAEPRMQVNDSPNTQMVFGIDVDGLQPGERPSSTNARLDIQ